MVQDSVERVIPNPRPEDLAAVRAEAREAAIRAGAHPASVQVHIEVNPQTQRVRATAWGATEMRARDLLRALSEAEARAIAAQSLKVEPGAVRLAGRTGGHWVFVTEVSERRLWIMKTTRRPVRVLDRGGFIKVQRADAEVGLAVASTAIDELRALWGSTTLYDGNGGIPPPGAWRRSVVVSWSPTRAPPAPRWRVECERVNVGPSKRGLALPASGSSKTTARSRRRR